MCLLLQVWYGTDCLVSQSVNHHIIRLKKPTFRQELQDLSHWHPRAFQSLVHAEKFNYLGMPTIAVYQYTLNFIQDFSLCLQGKVPLLSTGMKPSVRAGEILACAFPHFLHYVQACKWGILPCKPVVMIAGASSFFAMQVIGKLVRFSNCSTSLVQSSCQVRFSISYLDFFRWPSMTLILEFLSLTSSSCTGSFILFARLKAFASSLKFLIQLQLGQKDVDQGSGDFDQILMAVSQAWIISTQSSLST